MTRGNPYLVLGADAVAFFRTLRKPTRRLGATEFHCMHCKTGRKAWGGVVDWIHKPGASTARLEALCETCESKMNRVVSAEDLPRLMKVFDIQVRGALGN